ncbi:MAG TPA: rod shape-determining protein MreD [bacterium]|nr:rod shape-determining protein MreD [bacterium]
MTRLAVYGILAVVSLALEVTWLSVIRPGGAVLDPLLILVVSAGLLRGPEEGAVVGAAAGLLQDVATGVPLGLGMLGNLCAGFSAGLGEGRIYLENVWLPGIAAFAMTMVRNAVWIGAGHLVSLVNVSPGEALRVTALAACYNGVIAIPIFQWLRRLDGMLQRLSERPR